MSKVVNGIAYVRIPEIHKGHCKGCVGMDQDITNDLCLKIRDENHCQYNGDMIYKIEEKKMKSLNEIIRSKAVEILEVKLQSECVGEYSTAQVDREIEEAIDEIVDSNVSDLISRSLDVNEYDKRNYIINKFENSCRTFINSFTDGDNYSGDNFVRQQATTLLEEHLSDRLESNTNSAVREYYLNGIFDTISSKFGLVVAEMINDGIEVIDSEKITNAIDASVAEEINSIIADL